MSDYTIEKVDGKWLAYCHHCNLVQRRTHDRMGLVLAAHAHLERKH